MNENKIYRVLSLDGGGSKGFYSLGVLKEIEAFINKPLCEHFNLVFGTSTGAIIAALIALGYRVDDIHNLYKKYVPAIMKARRPKKRSAALSALADQVFQDKKFDSFKMDIGIVTVQWMTNTPVVFKSSQHLSFSQLDLFTPGFGCTISEAVQASCSAYPFFLRKTLTTSDKNTIELADGGYCANNPTLYAIASAIAGLKIKRENVRVINVGVGTYPDSTNAFMKWCEDNIFLGVHLLQKTIDINAQSMDKLRTILYRDIPTIRISDTFEEPSMATSFLEYNLDKLNILYQKGGASYKKYAQQIQGILLR